MSGQPSQRNAPPAALLRRFLSRQRSDRRGAVLPLATLCLALALPMACGSDSDDSTSVAETDQPSAVSEPPHEAPRPNIIIYLIDTVRRDHLGIYRYNRRTTPNLAALAKDAITFDNAFATASWTKSSTASLLSGLYPIQHGATSRNSRLKGDVKLLANYLEPLGYYRAAVVTNPFVVAQWGFDRGYDRFIDLGEGMERPEGWQRIEAPVVNRKALEILDNRPPDQPFFLYMHTIDVHGPNTPKPPFNTRFTDHPIQAGTPGRLNSRSSPRKVQDTIDLYDGEISYADDYLGKFLDQLRTRGLYEDTVIWFVSDHGEEFLDHGRGGHGTQLFNEVLKVPLMLKLPGNEQGGTRVQAPVSLVDVLATQLRMLEVSPPEDRLGLDLLTLTGPRWEKRPLYMDLNLVAGPEQHLYVSRGVLLDRYKYFEELHPTPQEYLFDLQADPGETHNLLRELPDISAELRSVMLLHRSSELSGLVVTAVGERTEEPQVFDLTLSTEGRFLAANPIDLETGDGADFQPGGRSLSLHFVVQGFHTNVSAKSLQQDFDSMALRIEPAGATVTLESATIGGSTPAPLFLGLKRHQALSPLTFSASTPELAAPELSSMFKEQERDPRGLDTIPSAPAGVYLIALPDRADLVDEIPEEMMGRLRALGYVR